MRKNIFKAVIIIVALLAVIIGVMYLSDLNRMKKGEEVIFSTWGAKYEPILKINLNENNDSATEKYQKYSKTIDNVKLELDIPNEWKYEEIPKDKDNDFYKYALKIYKNSEEQYAMLYYYNNQFAVCGTERTTKKMVLNNNKEATIGYYYDNQKWQDVSFYNINKNVAVINNGLINNEADELLEVIKTINIVSKL